MLPNYKYFITIVEQKSLTKAAEKLYISQPSLSQYLKRLESELDVSLFDRHTAPMRLTPEGERYYAFARQLLRMEGDIRDELQDMKDENVGRLRLGIALWRGACLLPRVLPAFREKYPRIRLELTEGSAAYLEKALNEDAIDLAILNLPEAGGVSGMHCEPILEEPILLAAPADHPAVLEAVAHSPVKCGYPAASPKLLKDLPLILTSSGQSLTIAVRRALMQCGSEPEILLETANLTTAINLVSAGMGCTFVPEGGVKICGAPDKLQYFLPDMPGLRWTLAALYPKDKYLPKAAARFIEVLKETLL